MTEAEIWNLISGDAQKHKAHPAWPSFCAEMRTKQYGIDPLNQAWAFYSSGWEASHQPNAGVLAVAGLTEVLKGTVEKAMGAGSSEKTISLCRVAEEIAKSIGQYAIALPRAEPAGEKPPAGIPASLVYHGVEDLLQKRDKAAAAARTLRSAVMCIENEVAPEKDSDPKSWDDELRLEVILNVRDLAQNALEAVERDL